MRSVPPSAAPADNRADDQADQDQGSKRGQRDDHNVQRGDHLAVSAPSSGHAAALPATAMNSRRLTGPSRARAFLGTKVRSVVPASLPPSMGYTRPSPPFPTWRLRHSSPVGKRFVLWELLVVIAVVIEQEVSLKCVE